MPPQEKVMESKQEDSPGRSPQCSQFPASVENPTGFDNAAFEGDVTLRNQEKNANNCTLPMKEIDLNSKSLTEKIPEEKNPEEKNDKNTLEPMDFDDILPYIGEFGRYQKMLFLMMIPFAFFVAFVYFTQIFITLVPENHWCWVPELANLTREERMNLAIPPSETTASGKDQCRMYAVNYTALLATGVAEPDASWPIVSCLHGWEYAYEDVPYETISSELDWVCEQSALPSIAQAIFFVGAIVGGLLFGWIADRYGRVSALLGTNMMGFIGGVATASVSNFWGFCVCRFLVGMAFDNCFTMMYILVLEYVGPKWRTFVANMSIAIFFTFATCILPWMAWYIADWRVLSLVTSVPLVISIFAPWVLPESARWLVSQGQIEKAVTICKRVEIINKMSVDQKIYDNFTESCYKVKKEEEKSNRSYSVIDLFRTPRLRNITILLILIWMAISLVFDGHVRNVGSLGYNVFITFTIASATELPADTFLTITLDRWGRRWLAFGTMAMSGVFSLLAVSAGGNTTRAVFAIIGRFAVNISYNIGLQYAAELLPTVVRAQGVALIHIMGYVASILAPFVVYLGLFSPTLPLLILGFLGIIGGCLALFLPETLNHELPQTLDDGENFGKNQKIWDFPCCMKKYDDNEEDISPERFTRTTIGSFRGSIRASVRGEIRSSMLRNGSIRSRRSVRGSSVPENEVV